MKNHTLKKRFITAACGIPLLVTVMWFCEPWFTIIIAIWGLLAAFEFYSIIARSKVPPLTYFGLIWILLFILKPHFDSEIITSALFTSAVILPLIWLLLRPNKEIAFTRWAWTLAGILYIGWELRYLVALRGLADGRNWVFLALFATFASDTTAYFVGRALGKHRLAPIISPGKTWEGAIAGVFSSIIVCLLFIIPTTFHLPLTYWQAIVLGVLVSIFGQIGDLFESLFKRNMGVKDTGKLLPGHGGFLDRIDSVVLAGIAVYYFVEIVIGL